MAQKRQTFSNFIDNYVKIQILLWYVISMKITYRPKIDGLRAIAIAAVILYHTQITIFGYQPFKV